MLSLKVEALVDFIGKKASLLIIALMAVIVTDVILRRWFVIGSTQLQELEWHLHGALFLLTIGWAYSREQHVRIELVRNHFSANTKAWIELIGCTCFLIPYVAAVIWFGIDYAAISFEYGETSASPSGLGYRWIIKSCMVVGFFLIGLVAISRLMQSFLYLFGGDAIRNQIQHFSKHDQIGLS